MKMWRDPEHRAVYTYGATNNFAYNLISQFTLTVNTIFLTDVAKVGVIMTGGIQTLQPIIKMCVASITGMLFDRQPFKKGRYYPWLQYLPPIMFLMYGLFFMVPIFPFSKSVAVPLLLILTVLSAIAQNMVFTLSYALYPLVTRNPNYRVAGSTVSNIFKEGGKLAVGSLYPMLLTMFCAIFMKDSIGYFLTYLVLGIGFVLIYWFAASEIKKCGVENIDLQKKEKVSAGDMFRALFTNPALLITFAVTVLNNTRNMGLTPLAPYYFKYVINDPKGLSALLSALPIVSIIFMLLAPAVIKLFKDQRLVACVMSLMTALFHCLVAWTPFGKTTMGVSILLAVAMGFGNIISVVTLNLYASSSDYGEWKTGKSNPGVAMSLYSIGIQVGSLLTTFLRTAGLNNIGYSADMTITPQVQAGFTNMISYMLALPMVAVAILVMFHPVSDKKLIQIRKEINERNAENINA